MKWLLFNLLIFLFLMVDLLIVHKKRVKISLKESLLWSSIWIFLSLLFNLFIYFFQGPTSALEFFTGYLIEKSLSLDNLFVILVILAYFKIPYKDQHAVLFWGILGALVMRLCFILAGLALINKFHWILYLLGLFLLFTGVKLLFENKDKKDFNKNRVIKLIKRLFPKVTPFMLALISIEYTDLVFALDSIPAIFSITKDPYIIYTSNVCAILGMRSLYFVLAHFLKIFAYLKIGISAILVFIGFKILISPFYIMPIYTALSVILGILLTSILFSLRASRRV